MSSPTGRARLGATAGQAVYIDAGGEPVFAMLDEPSGASRRATAVLLCPPIGWPDVSSYRGRRAWAQTLAGDGYPTLRLDLPGTGDSAGGPRDPDLVQRWVTALCAAAAWLREVVCARRTAAVGVGLGGLILYRALSEGAAIDDVVLWGVSARGRTHLREQRAFTKLEQTQQRGPADTSLPEGGLLTAGFLMSAETITAIDALDVSDLPRPDVRRALLLERDGITVDTRLQQALAGAEIDVRTGPGDGFADMFMAEPQEARPSDAALAQITGWLVDEPLTSSCAESDRGTVAIAPVASSTDVGADGGATVHETPLWFDTPQGRLFAVLAEPPGSPSELCAVLLNAGAQRRIGVNRMWVEIARRWAARGVPTLRVDLEAIGDADGAAARFGDIGAFYVPEFVGQVRAVLDGLVQRGMPDRFLVLGLCSGAYWSFQAALQDDRIAAAVMLNPRVLVWDDAHRELYEEGGGRRMRRHVLSLRSWRRLLTTASMWRRAWMLTTTLLPRLAHPVAYARSARGTRIARATVGGELDRQLDLLRDRGQRGMLLFTAEEPLHAELRRNGQLARLERWPNLVVASDPRLSQGTADNHTLRPLWLQKLVHEQLDAALDGELARTADHHG